MKKLNLIIFPLLFIISFACVTDEPEMIEQDGELDKFLNSSFYLLLHDQGYRVDKEKIEFRDLDSKLAIKVPINKFPENMRVVGSYSELLLVSEDVLHKNPKSLLLSYESVPKENYSGEVYVYDYLSSYSEPVTFVFENGKLKNRIGLNERVLNNRGCTTRAALACTGYRIEEYNWIEGINFAIGFPGTFLWEIASCIADGCPYD